MNIVAFLLIIVIVYLGCGIVFALLFVFFGVTKVSETARGATAGFRIIILPGVTLLWPVLLRKWLRVTKKTSP